MVIDVHHKWLKRYQLKVAICLLTYKPMKGGLLRLQYESV
jgi:hypothetical protein